MALMYNASVSLHDVIELLCQKVYTDLMRLVDLLPSKTDFERKVEIATFLSRTRHLFIRLLALTKWASGVSKVDKCESISNFLDTQRSYLLQTANSLSYLLVNTLVNARLPPFSLFLAIDVFTNRGYSRLPKCIVQRFLPQNKITRLEKKQALADLNRIILQRLSVTQLPRQFQHVSIGEGKVTFTVPSEFQITMTLMSEALDFPWRIINVKLILKDPEFGSTNKIVHMKQNQFIHAHLQSRILHRNIDNRPPLHIIYESLHSFCMALQLDLLHEQVMKSKARRFEGQVFVEYYRPGHSLCVSYWRDLAKSNFHPTIQSDGRIQPQAYMLLIHVDEVDNLKPLAISHLPKLSIEDDFRIGSTVKGENVSFERLISKTIMVRADTILEDIKRELMILSPGPITSGDMPLCINVPILWPCTDRELLRVRLDAAQGSLHCCFCGLAGAETTLQTECDMLNSDQKLTTMVQSALKSLDKALNKPSARRIDEKQSALYSSIQNKALRQIVNEDSRQKIAILSAFEKLRLFLGLLRLYHSVTRNRVFWQPVSRTLPIVLPSVGPGKPRPPYYDVIEAVQSGDRLALFIKLFPQIEEYLLIEVHSSQTGAELLHYKIYMIVCSSIGNSVDLQISQDGALVSTPSLSSSLSPVNSVYLKVTHFVPLDDNLLKINNRLQPLNASSYKVFSDHFMEIRKKRDIQSLDSPYFGIPEKRPRLEEDVHKDVMTHFTTVSGLDNLLVNFEESLLSSSFLHELLRLDVDRDGFKYDETGQIICVDIISIPLNMIPKWVHTAAKKLDENLISMRLRPRFYLKQQAYQGRTWHLSILFKESLIPRLDSNLKLPKQLYSFEFAAEIPQINKDLIPKWVSLGALYELISPAEITFPGRHFLLNLAIKSNAKIKDLSVVESNPHSIIKQHLEIFLNSFKNLFHFSKILVETLPFLTAMDTFRDASLTHSYLPIAPPSIPIMLKPVRNFAIICQSIQDIIIIYRGSLALRLVLQQFNPTSRECLLNTADSFPGYVHLADAYNHLSLASFPYLVPLPAFKYYLATLEDSFPCEIEAGSSEALWPGLTLQDLLALTEKNLQVSSHISSFHRKDSNQLCALETYLSTSLMFHAAHLSSLHLHGQIEGVSTGRSGLSLLADSSITSRGEIVTCWYQSGLQTRIRMIPKDHNTDVTSSNYSPRRKPQSWILGLEVQPYMDASNMNPAGTISNWNPGVDCLYLIEHFFQKRVFASPYEPIGMKAFHNLFLMPSSVLKVFLRLISWDLYPPQVYDSQSSLGPSMDSFSKSVTPITNSTPSPFGNTPGDNQISQRANPTNRLRIRLSLVSVGPTVPSMNTQAPEFTPGQPALMVQGSAVALQLYLSNYQPNAAFPQLSQVLNLCYQWDRNIVAIILPPRFEESQPGQAPGLSYQSLAHQLRNINLEQQSNEYAAQTGENALLQLCVNIAQFLTVHIQQRTRQMDTTPQQAQSPQPMPSPSPMQYYHRSPAAVQISQNVPQPQQFQTHHPQDMQQQYIPSTTNQIYPQS